MWHQLRNYLFPINILMTIFNYKKNDYLIVTNMYEKKIKINVEITIIHHKMTYIIKFNSNSSPQFM